MGLQHGLSDLALWRTAKLSSNLHPVFDVACKPLGGKDRFLESGRLIAGANLCEIQLPLRLHQACLSTSFIGGTAREGAQSL